MKQYNITLTEIELQQLTLALSAAKIRMDIEADHLAEHNTTGINTRKIESKRRLSKAYENLFDKMMDFQFGA